MIRHEQYAAEKSSCREFYNTELGWFPFYVANINAKWKRQRHDHNRDEGEAAPAVGEHQEDGSDQAAQHAQQQRQLRDSRRFQMW